MPDVWAQDHGVLWDTVLDDFEGLPDVPVGTGDRPDADYAHFITSPRYSSLYRFSSEADRFNSY